MRERLGGVPAAIVRGLAQHGHVVWSLAFTGDGIACSPARGTAASRCRSRRRPARHTTADQGAETYQRVRYEPTGLVASTYIDGRVVLWRLQDGELRRIGLLDRRRATSAGR